MQRGIRSKWKCKKIAEEMIAKKIPSLKDFEGPVYIRASEAEEKLTLKASS